ncbi:crossover junction endonuclease EME1 isoform X3 [Cryptotermes secundus]|uniref:crossover junction endonuclease EME1 isoform X3 n=1 Tax=Cryptotermes secundus TaxID=105785 RepID=UPI000CD7B981|nr:crossover junction endonuclease EME1 isoform X3 [Cryptotermes secundus]
MVPFDYSCTCHLDMREAMQGRDQLPSIGNVLAEDCSEKGQKKQRAKKSVIGIEKEGKRAERMKNRAMMKAEQAQKKALKMAAAEAYRCKKPGECLKYIQVCLDQQLLTAEYGGEILVSLQSAEMQYNIQSNLVPCSIFWTREVQEHFVGEDMEVHVRSRKEEEEEILIVWHWEKVMRLIHAVDLTNHIQSLQLTLPGKKLTLVVYGVEQYFRYHNSSKRQEVRAKVGKLKTSKKTENFENTPRISRDKFDTALTELQLFADCSHRLVEKPHDLGTFIRQFSKAIAEVPFKHEKQKREQEKLEWYAAGDSRNCVRVDKNGNGLLRLWQQQLCQFNRVSMETAQAISSVYRSPCALIQAYENCSSETESELMLESIQIRRGVGPLTTVKKVGPDLSKKMYTFFRSFDGKATLSQE